MNVQETTELVDALELVEKARQRIALMEQEIDMADARNDELQRALEQIRIKVREFTDGDMNPHRGMLYELSRIAGEALS